MCHSLYGSCVIQYSLFSLLFILYLCIAYAVADDWHRQTPAEWIGQLAVGGCTKRLAVVAFQCI